jgi:hypothetical protein
MQKRTKRAASEIAIDLQIGGEVWHRVDSFAGSGPDDRHFVATTDESGSTTVRFGDGAHGARLPDGADAIVAAYRGSKRFVAVVQQQGRVIVDKDWREAAPTATDRLCGVYRGVVTNNLDPLQRSRVQVDVANVPADVALWATPCRPPGSTSVPAVGAGVWIAYEAGDPSRPVWIGIS